MRERISRKAFSFSATHLIKVLITFLVRCNRVQCLQQCNSKTGSKRYNRKKESRENNRFSEVALLLYLTNHVKSAFHASVLLLTMNFVITLSK